MAVKIDKDATPKSASATVVGEDSQAAQKKFKLPKNFGKLLAAGLIGLALLICLGKLIQHINNNNKNVVIGNTTITPKDVNELSDEITQYTNKNQNVSFGKSPHKVARDDLILNAALKNEAAKDHVTVTQADIDAAQTNQYHAYGSKAAYARFVRLEGIPQLTKVTSENDAYKAKLENKVIAKKDLFIAGIIYDTPYVNNSKNPTPEALRKQALQTVQNKFLPLFQQGKSAAEIAAQADISPNRPNTNNGAGSPYFSSMPSVAFYAHGCTTAKPCFNDVKSKPVSGLPPLVSTQNAVDKLNTIGQNTGVINSEAGFVGVIRLTGKTSGSYNSWDQFQQSYEKKYADGKLLALGLLPRNQVIASVQALKQPLRSINHGIGLFLWPKVAADVACTDNVRHFVPLNIHAYNQNGANLSGVGVIESRAHAGCPNADGKLIGDDNGIRNKGTTNAGGTLLFNDNCYNSDPTWAQTPPSNNSLSWVHVSDGAGENSTMVVGQNFNGTPITESNAINRAVSDSGIWTNGILNSAGGLTIELHYKQAPPPGWDLNGKSTVDGVAGTITKPAGATVTFRHGVNNTGPDTANYTWAVKDDSTGAYANHGLPTAFQGAVGAGGSAPNIASYAGTYPGRATYSIPASAKNGDTYCQRIDYTNANGPGTATQGSSPACVKVGNPSPKTSFGCTETKVQHFAGYLTEVVLSGTDQDNGGTGHPVNPGGPDLDLTYNALSPKITITTHVYHNTGTGADPVWTEEPTSPTNQYFNCYHASCYTPTVIDGQGPNGEILAGQQFRVLVPVKNDNGDANAETIPSSVGGYNFSLTEPPDDNQGGFAGHATGFGLDVGEQETATISFTAPSSVRNFKLIFYPDLYGHGSLNPEGNQCSVTIPVYQQFNSSLSALTQLKPTAENPYQGADYKATINVQNGSSHNVQIPTTSLFYKKPAAGGQVNIDSSSGGTYPSSPSPGTTTATLAGHYDIPAGYMAGDEYCVSVHADYTTGYVGPGDNVVGAAGPADAISCPRIANEPYFKVYHSDISAGGEFDKCTTNGGTLAGYADISDPAGATRGSTTQLSALALLKITGVASAKTSADITGSPTKLTFANTGVQVDSGGNESPVLGGQFGGCRTLTNETAPASATALTSSTVPPTLAPGAYTYGTGNSELTIPGGLIGANQNYSIFVKGDVYISNNITYGNGWAAGTAPSFILHATGNIYIAPGVTQLAGIYIAQAKSDGTAGKIYTCADATGFAPMSTANLYNGCKNQLVVYGSFVADQINLMRSFGSLRDEIPNPGSPGTSGAGGIAGLWSCGGGSCNPNLSGYTCIHTNEPKDPDSYTWADNQLCLPSSSTVKMAWTYDAGNSESDKKQQKNLDEQNGRVSLDFIKAHGYPYCTQWTPKASDGTTDDDKWNDNYLCLSQDIGLTFGTNPNPPGQVCLRVYEPADPLDNWPAGYYLCAPISGGTPPTPPTAKGPPFTSCSNKGTEPDNISCAGEVFEYSPALYLSNGGGTTQPPGGGSLQLQSITSLPPVL